MKSLAFFALSAIASAAMAVTPVDPAISISGTSNQSASLVGTAVSNTANTNDTAQQNLASNAGNVTISGTSNQSVTSAGGVVSNTATGGNDAYASQNLSSNMGNVTIAGHSSQSTSLTLAAVTNLASGASSKAVQNIASNNACVTCQSAPASSGPHWPF
jgi:hypothetical protein